MGHDAGIYRNNLTVSYGTNLGLDRGGNGYTALVAYWQSN